MEINIPSGRQQGHTYSTILAICAQLKTQSKKVRIGLCVTSRSEGERVLAQVREHGFDTSQIKICTLNKRGVMSQYDRYQRILAGLLVVLFLIVHSMEWWQL